MRGGEHAIKIVFILLILTGCEPNTHDTISNGISMRIPAVYTRFLTFPVPSMGVDAPCNPPVLRWPAGENKTITYDVRLSRDSLFMDGETISVSNIPWAMFNPHRELASGRWYWQYKTSGTQWSELLHFQVTDEASAIVSPPATEFLAGIPADHPRVLAQPSGIKELHALLQDEDAKAIIREAKNALDVVLPPESDGIPKRTLEDAEKNRKLEQGASKRLGDTAYNTIIPLCQAYLLSGDDRYRKKALSFALEVAEWDPEGVSGSGSSDFSDARCMLAMATAFDTFYDQISLRERSILLKAIHARASGFYSSWTNNIEAKLLSGHVWQHILHYFFQTAIAMHGHDPDAANWLTYAYELFLARTPVLGGADGGWAEGASYFRMNMETMLDIPLFIRQYTGFDFIKAHPWYAGSVDWLIYHIPPGSSADGFGDNTEEVLLPGIPYVAFAREIAKLKNSKRAAWYVRECEQYENINLSANPILRWVRLAKTGHLPLPAIPDDPGLETGKVFRDIGLVSMHANPQKTSEDLMVAMRSSPFGSYGHLLSDQNAFNILYGGEKIFYRTGYKVTMKDPHRTGWYQHTKSNNSILIDGEGQPYSCEAFGWIPRFIQGKEIAYAKGDASHAYASAETGEDHGVKKFYRHLILLKPDIVVIYDELESGHDAEWSWLIHSMKKIDIDTSANTFRSAFDKVKGVGKLWSADPVQWVLADTFDVPAVNWLGSKDHSGKLKSYENEQWHLKAINKVKTSEIRFLAVLQVSPNADANAFVEDTRQAGMVEVSAGKWTISASLDRNLPPGVTITDDAGNTIFTTHLDRIELADKVYEGNIKGSAKLGQIVNGEAQFTEVSDQMPVQVRQSWLYYHHKKQ